MLEPGQASCPNISCAAPEEVHEAASAALGTYPPTHSVLGHLLLDPYSLWQCVGSAYVFKDPDLDCFSIQIRIQVKKNIFFKGNYKNVFQPEK